MTYTGTATVTSGTVSVLVLQFTMTGATIAGFVTTSPCAGHTRITESTGGRVAATGPMSLDVTELTSTIGGVAKTYTPASPPDAAFPSPLSMSSVSMWATQFAVHQLTLGGMTTTAASC